MMPVDIWSRLSEYGFLVLLLSITVFAAYKRLWVSGSFHDKTVQDLRNEYNSEIETIRKERDIEINRLRDELVMWRNMVIDSLKAAHSSNQTAKGAIDLAASKTRE